MPKKYIRTAHKMAGSTVPTHLIPLLPCLEHWHRHLGPLGGLAPDALAEHGAQIGAGQTGFNVDLSIINGVYVLYGYHI